MEKRIIKTNISGKKANEILSGVIGQMSDGMFEDSKYYNGYWMFVNIDKNNNICIDKRWSVDRWGRTIYNKFYGKKESWVKEFFANMIKRIIQQELRDNDISVRCKFKKGNMMETKYLNYYETVTVDDCVNVYEMLLK